MKGVGSENRKVRQVLYLLYKYSTYSEYKGIYNTEGVTLSTTLQYIRKCICLFVSFQADAEANKTDHHETLRTRQDYGE